MSDEIQLIRHNYDLLAESYALHLFDELRNKPFDRKLLTRFAGDRRGRGEVCDMGCGPGHIARHLHDAGADVFGLDLSPAMVHQARALNPGLRFVEGDMLALPFPDGALAGIAAFYAIVNIPPAQHPQIFREIARVLQPGGLLLLTFHIGNEVLQPKELWGQPVSMSFFLFQPTAIQRQIENAGLQVEEALERAPYAPEVEYQSQRAYIFARKSGALPPS